MLDKPTIIQVIETFTPEDAKSILEGRNNHNRKITPNVVRWYAKMMKEGRWRLNGESIIFSDQGELMDGQHRLAACVLANTSFETAATYGINSDTFETHGQGRKRSVGDILSIDGASNVNALAASIRWIVILESGKSTDSSVKIAPDEARIRWVMEPAIERSVTYGLRVRKTMATGVAGALHYMFSKKDEAAADRFFDDLAAGSGLSIDDPVHVLRERLLSEKLGKTKLKMEEVVSLSIRAWSHRRRGRRTRSLKGSIIQKDGTRIFPEIE